MITRSTSNNLDVSVDSFLAQFTDGLEEGGTCDATNKEEHVKDHKGDGHVRWAKRITRERINVGKKMNDYDYR